MTNSQPGPERAAYADGWRQLAAIIEAGPDVPIPTMGTVTPVLMYFDGEDARERMAACRRAIRGATWEKSVSGKDDRFFNLTGTLGGLRIQLYAEREAVCTRRVVGTEDVEVDVEIQAAVTERRTETREIVEWNCSPVLAAADEPQAVAS